MLLTVVPFGWGLAAYCVDIIYPGLFTPSRFCFLFLFFIHISLLFKFGFSQWLYKYLTSLKTGGRTFDATPSRLSG